MPLFELNTARSGELKAAYQLADRLSESTSFQQLAEAADAATALTSIKVGIAEDPVGGEDFEQGDLEARHFFAQVYAAVEESHDSVLDAATYGTPRQAFEYRVYLRRQVRESEDRDDAYNFFWDRVSAIGTEVLAAAEAMGALTNRNRFQRVARLVGPQFGERKANAAQGEHLEALLGVVASDQVDG